MHREPRGPGRIDDHSKQQRRLQELSHRRGEDDEETKACNRQMVITGRQDQLMKRGQDKDFFNRLMIERNEAEQEQIFVCAQESRELHCRQKMQIQRLNEDLLRKKSRIDDDICDQKRKQVMINNSVELQQLKRQIAACYAAKDISKQISERELLKKNVKIRESEQESLDQDCNQIDKFEKQQQLEAHRKKKQYRRDLQNQLELNNRLRQQKFEEIKRERKIFEELSEVEILEDCDKQQRKREIAAQLLAEQKDFVEAQESRKCEEKRLLKENEDYASGLIDKIVKRKQIEDAKTQVLEAREAVIEKIRKKILDEESKKKERENIINEFIVEKQRNELDNQLMNDALQKRRAAKELLDDIVRQKIEIKERKAKDAEAEREFAEYLKKEHETYIISEKRKYEERRERGIEYGKALKEAIANQGIRYANGVIQNEAELKRDKDRDEAIQNFISEEKLRIINEHAPRLEGFFKPSMIESVKKSG